MVVDETKQVTVATLLKAWKELPWDCCAKGGHECDNTKLVEWSKGFEGLLLQFQKQLFDDVWELTEQELIRHKQAHPQRLLTFDNVHAIVHKITKQILGDVAK